MAVRRGKTRVAVLGGGVGAMTAAFELTASPAARERYEVTVYQLGWRLGGKGASGRNAACAQRIEEHGLHIWFGMYDNAFRVMRQCYEELGRAPGLPLATWQDAFHPADLASLAERDGPGDRYGFWNITFPRNCEVPGSPGELPSLWGFLQILLGWMEEQLEAAPGLLAVAVKAASEGLLSRLEGLLESVGSTVLSALRGTSDLHRAAALARALPADLTSDHRPHHDAIAALLESFAGTMHAAIDTALGDCHLRRIHSMLDLATAAVRGILAEGVLWRPEGLDVLDHQELSAFLLKYGAHPRSVAESPYLKSLYDACFAYQGGDTARRNFAAGSGLRASLRLGFAYKGAMMYKMQAGMGDTVFTPFYQVLRQRGVRFRFFHRIESLGLSADGGSIDELRLSQQATLKSGDDGFGYEPLVDVKGLPCWPSEPLYDQLVEGEALRRGPVSGEGPYNLESHWTSWPGVAQRTLKAGQDFDQVVLGISVGALSEVCAELVAARPAWKAMVEKVGTVQTQACQLWLKPTLAEMGWEAGPTVLAAYVDPYNSWADMSHLLPRADWPADNRPGSVQYLCGPLPDASHYPSGPDPKFPVAETDAARGAATAWLQESAEAPWPEAVVPGTTGLDRALLVDLTGGNGDERLKAQYFRANIDPSERYVLSLAGSLWSRLWPGGSGFSNLYLAGDWTRNGLNSGCVEAAVQSGLLAARAVLGDPSHVHGESDRGGSNRHPGRE